MKPKFAAAIARNIRIMAENAALLAVIDSNSHNRSRYRDAHTSAVEAITKAEHNIAQWLMQPGVYQND